MAEDPNGSALSAAIEPPRGFYQARVDEKGRLKLPVNFQQFLAGLGEQKVFITTLDLHLARIYPISAWKENEKVLAEQADDDPQAAEDILFIANEFGADSELDSQGRLLVPTELRRELNLENQPVWLEASFGAISLYSKAEFESRRQRSREGLDEKLVAFKKKGLR